MAKLNRYDSPAESNYFNTFVPLPLDQITALGMKRQEDLERKQDMFSRSVDDASMIDYVPGSIDESRVKNEFLPHIQQLAEEAMSIDLSNPVEWAKYSTKIKRLSVSDEIKRIEQSSAGYKQALAIANEQRMRGVYNPLLDDTLKRAQSLDSRNEIFNYVPESQIDKSKLFEPYYKDIGQDYSARVNVGTKDNPLWVLRQGISDNKIRAIGTKAAQDLAATGGGNQIVRLARMENPALYADMSDREILESQMYEYGKSRSDFRDQILSDNMQGTGTQTSSLVSGWSPIATGGTGEKLRQDPAGVLSDLETASLIDNKNLRKNALLAAGKSAMGAGQYIDNTDYSVKELSEGTMAKLVDKIISKYPELSVDKNGKKLSNKEIIDQYKEITNNKMGGAMYVSNDPAMNEYLSSLLDNRFLTYKYIIPGMDESFTPQEIMDKAGIKKVDDFRKAISPAGPALDVPNGMSVSIAPNAKNRYTDAIKKAGNQIIAVGDIEIDNQLKPLRALKRMVETGQEGPMIISNDDNYLYGVNMSMELGERNGNRAFVPVYQKFRSSGNGDMELMYITDSQGNKIPDLVTMDDVYGEVVNSIFRGNGSSPYDINLQQSVSSTGRRIVRP